MFSTQPKNIKGPSLGACGSLRPRHTMQQIAATHRGDKSPGLHCCCDKSLRQDTCSVHASEFGRGEM